MGNSVLETAAMQEGFYAPAITHDCRILAAPHQMPLAQKVAERVSKFSKCGIMDAKALSELRVRYGSEMGVIVVLIDEMADLAPVEAKINRIRDAGAFVGVLGVSASCLAARSLTVGPFLDGVISLEWSAAEAMIGQFVSNHRARIQNRAFRAYLDSSSEGYWIWNVEEDEIEWSKRTCEMTGMSGASVPTTIGEFSDLIHPLDRDRVQQAIENHLFKSAPYKNIEMRIRRGDGRHGHFLANGQALRNEQGKAIILVGSLTDRTLMQRVEQQLEDTQKRFTVLFHHMNDAAVLADIETGMILEANQPAERLWRKSIAELVGCHQSELHPPMLTDVAKKAFRDHVAALMTNKRDSIQVPILRSDGTEVPAEISSSLIELEDKVMVLGVFRDISDRVKADRELRERDAQLQLSSHLASMGTLAAGVAHEINNPLTYMLGNLEILKDHLAEEGIEDDAISESLEAAWTGGRYVREIVSDLKAITKMDSTDDECDPCEVIRIASRMALADLRHRAQLDLKLSEVPKAKLASARLSQVVLNVLSNASHAFRESDRSTNRILVEVFSKRDRVIIVIEDNGMGISEEDLMHVSEPFFTRRGENGGTGLGLSICRRIISEAGGDLKITSKLGEGTKVSITLPSVGQEAGAKHRFLEDNEIVLSERKRIVVVDDEPLVTNLVDRVLRKHFEVVVFNDARGALKCINQGAEFDLVLCDIMMPEMDGRRFYEAIGDRLPFLFLTGGAVTEENVAFASKMDQEGRVIYKPFEAANLIRAVKQMLVENRIDTRQRVASDAPKDLEPARTLTIIQPDPITYAELMEVMGRDTLKAQYDTLQRQLAELCAKSEGYNLDGLAQEAHRVAGGAAVLGLKPIAKLLKAVQNAAEGKDEAVARGLISEASSLQAPLSAFVDKM